MVCQAGLWAQAITTDARIQAIFNTHQIRGATVVLDLQEKKVYTNDEAIAATPFFPASTFKIPNTLIGFKTGVISGPDYVFKWDGVKRRDTWDKDLTMKEAFRVSCLPCYQSIARMVGQPKMDEMVRAFQYGDMKTSGGVDVFWLEGDLKIKPLEQLAFLYKVDQGMLPVDKQHIEWLREMMFLAENGGKILRGKTGWSQPETGDIGWFVGWVENGEKRFYYATVLTLAAGEQREDFGALRRQISEEVLTAMGFW